MNGDGKKEIPAKFMTHHTGTVWSATFEKPDMTFLSDMTWEVYYKANGQRPDFCASSIFIDEASKTLELRFNDFGKPPLGDADIGRLTARLMSPRS